MQDFEASLRSGNTSGLVLELGKKIQMYLVLPLPEPAEQRKEKKRLRRPGLAACIKERSPD
eukprot:1142189-Pelagomonas_calceolata.AAC.1